MGDGSRRADGDEEGLHDERRERLARARERSETSRYRRRENDRYQRDDRDVHATQIERGGDELRRVSDGGRHGERVRRAQRAERLTRALALNERDRVERDVAIALALARVDVSAVARFRHHALRQREQSHKVQRVHQIIRRQTRRHDIRCHLQRVRHGDEIHRPPDVSRHQRARHLPPLRS